MDVMKAKIEDGNQFEMNIYNSLLNLIQEPFHVSKVDLWDVGEIVWRQHSTYRSQFFNHPLHVDVLLFNAYLEQPRSPLPLDQGPYGLDWIENGSIF